MIGENSVGRQDLNHILNHTSMKTNATDVKNRLSLENFISLNPIAMPSSSKDLSSKNLNLRNQFSVDGKVSIIAQEKVLINSATNPKGIVDKSSLEIFSYIEYPNGDQYRGFIKNGKPSGVGTMKYAEGFTYYGNFWLGLRHGDGELSYNNGDYLRGSFYYDRVPTCGQMRKTSREIVYEGFFLKGIPHGFGKLMKEETVVFTGNFINGVKHGYGILRFANGSVYEGNFIFDQPNGMGKLRFANGNVFDGEFKDGFMNGWGMIRYRDGTVRTIHTQNDEYIRIYKTYRHTEIRNRKRTEQDSNLRPPA